MKIKDFFKIANVLNENASKTGSDDAILNAVLINAFDQLEQEEKVVLLQRAINDPETVIADAHDTIQPSKITSSIEQANQIEMIRLKTWLIKMIFLSGFICFFIFIMIMIFMNGKYDQPGVEGYLDDLSKILNLILFNKT